MAQVTTTLTLTATRLVACPELWYRYVSESGN